MNAGSSSLKVSLLDGAEGTDLRTSAEWGADATREADRERGFSEALHRVASEVGGIDRVQAVGHRVVHGGARFVGPVPIDERVVHELDQLATLAPLHNPVALEAARVALRLLPGVPHVASFDTAFHASLPEAWRRYPVPAGWSAWGVRRYGFHGLSVAWSVRRSAELLARPIDELRLVVAHLGSGCSVTAVDGGRSVATSMGMTPLEGLMMGTRAGSIDPGILIALLREERVTLERLSEALDHESGLLAVSGTTSDMRRLQADAAAGDERARLAIEMFVARAAAAVGAAATSLPRLDALVFTGGIGEHAAGVRSGIVGRLEALGIPPVGADPVAEDGALGSAGAGPQVLRVEAREDRVIAAEAEDVISSASKRRFW